MRVYQNEPLTNLLFLDYINSTKIANALNLMCHLIMPNCGLYYKTITIIIKMIVSDATIWSITYDRN